jgi:hypothetical protein
MQLAVHLLVGEQVHDHKASKSGGPAPGEWKKPEEECQARFPPFISG